MEEELSQYIRDLDGALRQGNATEHTYRPAIKNLIELAAPGFIATNEPRRVACGAPDFLVTTGSHIPVGHIETKDVTVSLGDVERDSERPEPTTTNGQQLKRYRAALRNLILTNYVEFRWYSDGNCRMEALLARGQANGHIQLLRDGISTTSSLFSAFLNAGTPVVQTSNDLAARMARIGILVRETVQTVLREENDRGPLHDQMEVFRRVLIAGLRSEEFSDMYAQTICYGMFAARCNFDGTNGAQFTRLEAPHCLPRTNPFLRKTFGHIAGPELDGRVTWIVDDLAELLNRTDMDAILKEFAQREGREDAVVHFYEDFLSAYDPKVKHHRGVYYTPQPIVRFIVQSIDTLLRRDFHIQRGLADDSKIAVPGEINPIHRVLILDPACGTGTFLYEVIDKIYESFVRGQNVGMWSQYVAEHLLPRLIGFELLMAPYSVAHMKVGLKLSDTGYDLNREERVQIYLTNTLEQESTEGNFAAFDRWLADEAREASRAKEKLPIMVVVGNPPYSKGSFNKSRWIEGLMENYKTTVRGEESQIQALSNDYIKFIRFAQWRIDQTGEGVLGFITGHGYIEGPQFRDMRESLLQSFNKLYILNLNGSVRRDSGSLEEDAPVFPIMQGTAIILAVKMRGEHPKREVHYFSKVGSLSEKFGFLKTNTVETIAWQDVHPNAPYHLLTPLPQNAIAIEQEYHRFTPLTDLWGTGNRQEDKEKRWATGFSSQQDEFAVAFTTGELTQHVDQLLASETQADANRHFTTCSTNQWNYTRAKRELAGGGWRQTVGMCAYRPFDYRYTAFDRNIVSILRNEVRQHLVSGNMALIVSRVVNDDQWAHTLVSQIPVDKIFLSSKTSTNAYVFPLFLTTHGGTEDLITTDTTPRLTSNLSGESIRLVQDRLGLNWAAAGGGDLHETCGPADLFHYIYAVLHSPAYRIRYNCFLRVEFPRIPITRNIELFRTLLQHGKDLVRLHLSGPENQPGVTFPVAGDNTIAATQFRLEPGGQFGRAYINPTQYFDRVATAAWDFRVGGYLPCKKWLDQRRGRVLTFEELRHFQQTVETLTQTISKMDEIDAAVQQAGGWHVE